MRMGPSELASTGMIHCFGLFQPPVGSQPRRTDKTNCKRTAKTKLGMTRQNMEMNVPVWSTQEPCLMAAPIPNPSPTTIEKASVSRPSWIEYGHCCWKICTTVRVLLENE